MKSITGSGIPIGSIVMAMTIVMDSADQGLLVLLLALTVPVRPATRLLPCPCQATLMTAMTEYRLTQAKTRLPRRVSR